MEWVERAAERVFQETVFWDWAMNWHPRHQEKSKRRIADLIAEEFDRERGAVGSTADPQSADVGSRPIVRSSDYRV